MNVVFRCATVSDAEQLRRHQQMVSMETRFLLTTPDEICQSVEVEREWIRKQLGPGNYLSVAEVAGKIVGVLNFERKTKERVRHQGTFGISVQQDYQGAGIGKGLIERLLEWAETEDGLEKIGLEVFASNARAIRLYEHLGFREEGRKVRYIKYDVDEYDDELLMGRFLHHSDNV